MCSCIVASIVRLYYAVEYTKVPATGDSFFQAPFIYNILWALIEPPVFIVAGSLLTLGPFFRGKYGPASVFRSLRSRLLSSFPRGSSKGSSAESTGSLPSFVKRSSDSGNKAWASTAANSTSDETGEIPSWELRALEDSTGERGPKNTQAMV